jgi:hypothetical protein
MNRRRSWSLSTCLLTLALALAGFSARAASIHYTGLIYSGVTNSSSKAGMFVMSVSATRKLSGTLTIGDRHVDFSGRFDTNGAADFVVKITIDLSCYWCDPQIIDIETKRLWHVYLQIDPGGSTISGTVHFIHGEFPDGMVFGKRSSFGPGNEVPAGGKFTAIFAGTGDSANTNLPTGDGFATMVLNPSGRLRLVGSLPGTSALSENTFLCDDGTFPVFESLYDDQGMIQGWVGLTNNTRADLAGEVVWVKPGFAGRAFYPAGFTNDVVVMGSRYVQTKPILNWTNGVVIFQGGKLSSPFTNAILLDASGAVANLSENPLAVKIQPSSGGFSGSVKDPVTGEPLSFTGVILQKGNGGSGFFPDAPLSGRVLFEPTGP